MRHRRVQHFKQRVETVHAKWRRRYMIEERAKRDADAAANLDQFSSQSSVKATTPQAAWACPLLLTMHFMRAFKALADEIVARNRIRFFFLPMCVVYLSRLKKRVRLSAALNGRPPLVTRPTAMQLRDSSALFQKWPEDVLQQFASKMVPKYFFEGNLPIIRGEDGRKTSVYFIATGTVVVKGSGGIVSLPTQPSLMGTSASASTSRPHADGGHHPHSAFFSQGAVPGGGIISSASGAPVRLWPGRIFGDIAALSGEVHRATFSCATDCICFGIDATDFLHLTHMLPPSLLNDTIVTAKQQLKARIALTPTVEDLRRSDPLFQLFPADALGGLIKLMTPAVARRGEVIVRDVCASSRIFYLQTGTVTLAVGSRIDRPWMKLEAGTTASCIGAIAVCRFTLLPPAADAMAVAAVADSFTELWSVAVTDVCAVIYRVPNLEGHVEAAACRSVAAVCVARSAPRNGPVPIDRGERRASADDPDETRRRSGESTPPAVDGDDDLSLHPSIATIRACSVFAFLTDKIANRVAEAFTLRSILSGFEFSRQNSQVRVAFIVVQGCVQLTVPGERHAGGGHRPALRSSNPKVVRDVLPGQSYGVADLLADAEGEVTAVSTFSSVVYAVEREELESALLDAGRNIYLAVMAKAAQQAGHRSRNARRQKALEDEMTKARHDVDKAADRERHIGLTRKMCGERAAKVVRAEKALLQEEQERSSTFQAAKETIARHEAFASRLAAMQTLGVEYRIFACLHKQMYGDRREDHNSLVSGYFSGNVVDGFQTVRSTGTHFAYAGGADDDGAIAGSPVAARTRLATGRGGGTTTSADANDGPTPHGASFRLWLREVGNDADDRRHVHVLRHRHRVPSNQKDAAADVDDEMSHSPLKAGSRGKRQSISFTDDPTGARKLLPPREMPHRDSNASHDVSCLDAVPLVRAIDELNFATSTHGTTRKAGGAATAAVGTNSSSTSSCIRYEPSTGRVLVVSNGADENAHGGGGDLEGHRLQALPAAPLRRFDGLVPASGAEAASASSSKTNTSSVALPLSHKAAVIVPSQPSLPPITSLLESASCRVKVEAPKVVGPAKAVTYGDVLSGPSLRPSGAPLFRTDDTLREIDRRCTAKRVAAKLPAGGRTDWQWLSSVVAGTDAPHVTLSARASAASWHPEQPNAGANGMEGDNVARAVSNVKGSRLVAQSGGQPAATTAAADAELVKSGHPSEGEVQGRTSSMLPAPLQPLAAAWPAAAHAPAAVESLLLIRSISMRDGGEGASLLVVSPLAARGALDASLRISTHGTGTQRQQAPHLESSAHSLISPTHRARTMLPPRRPPPREAGSNSASLQVEAVAAKPSKAPPPSAGSVSEW